MDSAGSFLFRVCNGAICFARIDELFCSFSPLYRTTSIQSCSVSSPLAHSFSWRISKVISFSETERFRRLLDNLRRREERAKMGVRVSKQEHKTSHPRAATVRIP